jgi:carbohydrate-binding DOMON domain-containing protein
MDTDEAQKIAGNFEGYGPSIYLMRVQEWRDLLGSTAVGDAVYMLLGARSQEGAAPKTVVVKHGNEDNAKNG